MRQVLFKRFIALARLALGQPILVYWYDPTKPPGGIETASGPSACPICNSHEYLA